MPKRRKPSGKKSLPTMSSRRTKTARPSHPTVTEIDPSKKQETASKQSRVIAMLQSPNGATIAAMMHETGWQQHSVRGFLAGVVRKKLKLKLQSKKIDGQRVYQIEGEGPPRASSRQSGRRPA